MSAISSCSGFNKSLTTSASSGAAASAAPVLTAAEYGLGTAAVMYHLSLLLLDLFSELLLQSYRRPDAGVLLFSHPTMTCVFLTV